MYLIRQWRAALIATFLILCLVATERRAESYGDTLQVALPVAALGCSVLNGDALEYTLRYAAMWLSVHATKHTLPGAMSERPHGGGLGFPSGHSSSAAFGASALVFSCFAGSQVLQTGAVLAAGFTGASRLNDHHSAWQVLAGWVWGVGFERALRRPGPLRARLARLFGRRKGA